MPEWMTGLAGGFLSGIGGILLSRLLSTPERRESALRSNYEVLLKRIAQLEAREAALMKELDRAEQKLDEQEKKLEHQRELYDDLERRYIRLIRQDGSDTFRGKDR